MLPDTSYHSHFSSPTNNHYLDFLVVSSLLDLGSIRGLGRSPGEGKDYPLQYSGLENSMDYAARGVAKSQTRLSDFHFISLLIFIVISPKYTALHTMFSFLLFLKLM